jgi:hypothetical protein
MRWVGLVLGGLVPLACLSSLDDRDLDGRDKLGEGVRAGSRIRARAAPAPPAGPARPAIRAARIRGERVARVVRRARGTFFEGAIVAGFPSDAAELEVMQNVKAAGYGQ